MKIEERDGAFVITDFDESEAYRIAEKVEMDGIGLYKRLAEKSDLHRVRETLELLLDQERDHLEFFSGQRDRLMKEKDYAAEENDLLSGIDYGIFQPYQSLGDLDKVITSPRKALRLGLIIEEKSINFYEACKRHVPSEATKREIGAIIEEERQHKKLLEDMLAELS